jgi:molecular chaperone GrpE
MLNDEETVSARAVDDAAGQTSETAPADAAAPLAAMTAEREQWLAEKAELQDRLLRRTAEFENYRRRVEREKGELRDFATIDVLGRVLPVLDDFERALKVACTDKEYARGMELIVQRLASELQKMGLEVIAAEGQPFDPNLHHALELAPTDTAPENTVLAEHQKGYLYRGKLVRPSLVRVAAAPAPGKQTEP